MSVNSLSKNLNTVKKMTTKNDGFVDYNTDDDWDGIDDDGWYGDEDEYPEDPFVDPYYPYDPGYDPRYDDDYDDDDDDDEWDDILSDLDGYDNNDIY